MIHLFSILICDYSIIQEEFSKHRRPEIETPELEKDEAGFKCLFTKKKTIDARCTCFGASVMAA